MMKANHHYYYKLLSSFCVAAVVMMLISFGNYNFWLRTTHSNVLDCYSSSIVNKNASSSHINFGADDAAVILENADEKGGPSSYKEWVKNHCWREGLVQNRARYHFLVTGAGYSATGFFSSAFTKAGYLTGHERDLGPGMVGLSDWLMSTRSDNQYTPFMFRHIFLLIRHPLKVLRSEYGTGWNFEFTNSFEVTSDVAHQEVLFTNSSAFQGLQVEFKTLEWWTIYTMLGENIAECYMRAEDISEELLLNMCLRSELQDCHGKPWYEIVHSTTGYNSHVKKPARTNDLPDDLLKRLRTWTELEQMIKTEDEQSVLEHARRVCQKYYSNEEC